MKHSSTRELFAYWNERRGNRLAPERGDIEPGEIRRVLADTFILTFDARTGHPFRIAGTRVCAAFGRELKGEAFVNLWSTETRTLVRNLLAVVAHETTAAVAGVRGANAEGCELDYELLVLPLRQRGRTDGHILGAFAPAEVPYWFGTNVLIQMSLGTLRYLGPERVTASGIPSAAPAGHPRRGLMVYDGGVG
jgi:hypothetical protein